MTQNPAVEAREVLASIYGSSLQTVRLPIDPVQVARALGVNVWQAQMPNEVSGIISRLDDGGDVEVFLNSEHAPVRQRFTTAHELGHFVRHRQVYGNDAPMYYKRDLLASCGTDADEIFANQFAAELLMPDELVRLYARSEDEFGLSRRFGVSLAAMGHRLSNLAVRAAG